MKPVCNDTSRERGVFDAIHANYNDLSEVFAYYAETREDTSKLYAAGVATFAADCRLISESFSIKRVQSIFASCAPEQPGDWGLEYCPPASTRHAWRGNAPHLRHFGAHERAPGCRSWQVS